MHVPILERLLQIFDCRFRLSQSRTHQRQIVRGHVGLCFSLHQFLQLALRFSPFARNRLNVTCQRHRFRVTSRKFPSPIAARQRFIVPALSRARFRQANVGHSKSGFHLDVRRELLDGFLNFPRQESFCIASRVRKHVSEVKVCERITGV
jgi:hypothetical protein